MRSDPTSWWFEGQSISTNVRIWWDRLISNICMNWKGCGCVCGAQAPDKWIWFPWRESVPHWYWDVHVPECLLSRDETGNLLSYE